MCEVSIGILCIYGLVIGAIIFFCWIGGKFAEDEVRSEYARLRRDLDDELARLRRDLNDEDEQELQHKKLEIASVFGTYEVTLSYYWKTGWFCTFVKDGKTYFGFIDSLSRYKYSSGQKMTAKVIRFDETYILKKV